MDRSQDHEPHIGSVTSGHPTSVAISLTADFEPEGFDDDLITWTFIARRDTAVDAGLYELRFVRILTEDERDAAFGRVLAKAEGR